MRQETQGVTETLIKNATEEFLEYGFTKASLVVLPVQVVSVQIQFIRVLKIKKVFLKLLWMTLLLV